MSCRLMQNIKHSNDYNAGGITEIYLLDIRNFDSYKFKDDKLYTECLVDRINISSTYAEISTTAESNFTEVYENGIYKQSLTSFIRLQSADKLSNLLVAQSNKYLVVFRTPQGKAYTFGSDGGASLSFAQQTGQLGGVSGYTITLSKSSIYPLFEVNVENFDGKIEWILQRGFWNGRGIWTKDGLWEANVKQDI